MTGGAGSITRMLAAPVTVCSACLGRWQEEGHPLPAPESPPEASRLQPPHKWCGRLTRGGPEVQSAAPSQRGHARPRGALILEDEFGSAVRSRSRLARAVAPRGTDGAGATGDWHVR
jgi:hypothetical protein